MSRNYYIVTMSFASSGSINNNRGLVPLSAQYLSRDVTILFLGGKTCSIFSHVKALFINRENTFLRKPDCYSSPWYSVPIQSGCCTPLLHPASRFRIGIACIWQVLKGNFQIKMCSDIHQLFSAGSSFTDIASLATTVAFHQFYISGLHSSATECSI
jgi:hypothetical protein